METIDFSGRQLRIRAPRMLCRKVLAFAVCCLAGRTFALDSLVMQSMVIVEGDKGRGSAFVVKMEGKVFLVTNSHVVRGNKNIKFKNLRNEILTTGPLQIADKVDAVRAELTTASPSLETAPMVEQNLKIGDEVIVAGNAEGAGVVREIPGKVVGIGPDRIEVDAPIVPGNSGSPILLKSTGQVIGVATYLIIPHSLRGGAKFSTSLNEVRRFGYRLDTVSKWIEPSTPDRISKEGLKLAEMNEVMSAVTRILVASADKVAKLGASAFVSREQAAANATFAALSAAIEEFVKNHGAAQDSDAKKNVAAFFNKLGAEVANDVRGYKEEHFSGYYAIQFKEQLDRRKEFHAWFIGTSMPAFRDAWLASGPESNVASSKKSSVPSSPPTTIGRRTRISREGIHKFPRDEVCPRARNQDCHVHSRDAKEGLRNICSKQPRSG